MLTPLDIHNQEFRRVWRGYSEDEVDDFLDKVVGDFESLLKDNATLRREVEELTARVDQYKQLETTLHGALVVAQGTADEVRQSARKEAQVIVREAEQEAGRIQRGGEARVHDLEERLAQLQREALAFRAQLRNQLETQLEMLRTDPPVLSLAGPRPVREGRAITPLPASGDPGETQVVPRTGS